MKALFLVAPLLMACGGSTSQQVVKDNSGRIRALVDRHHGRKEGPVRFYDTQGRISTTGQYARDSRNGTWATVGPHGDTLALVTYRYGKKDGLQAYWAENGQLLRMEHFREGRPDGLLYRFFADGAPRQVTRYDRGVPNGTYIEWYKVDSTSVAITAGQFKDGQRTGRWTWFYGNGHPQRQGHYRAGTMVGTWHYWNAQGDLTATKHLKP